MHVDQPGRDVHPGRVHDAVGLAEIQPDRGDLPVADQHVRAAFKHAGGVEDGSVGNENRGRLGHQPGSCASGRRPASRCRSRPRSSALVPAFAGDWGPDFGGFGRAANDLRGLPVRDLPRAFSFTVLSVVIRFFYPTGIGFP